MTEKIMYFLLLTRLERIAPRTPVPSAAMPKNQMTRDKIPHTSALTPNCLASFSGCFDGASFTILSYPLLLFG